MRAKPSFRDPPMYCGAYRIPTRPALSMSLWLCRMGTILAIQPDRQRWGISSMNSDTALVHSCVNSQMYEATIPANRLLLQVLREELGLTGTKRGCDDGSCGACTIIVGGEPMLACMMLAVSMQNCSITTIEGIAADDTLHPLQDGFCLEGEQQCGYCTPGMIMTAKALLDSHPHTTADEVRHAISGNFCRCIAYGKVIESILQAARQVGRISSEAYP
jgi:aerobic carbon-monoxide dehydrogenase small subunit